jgi:hypothetical protein
VSDFIFGFNADTLNTFSQRLYQGLYPKYFKDSQAFSQGGKSYKLSWNVPSAPVFDLKSKVDVPAIADEAIADEPLPYGLVRAQLVDAFVDKYTSRSFDVVLTDVALTLEIDGKPVQDTATITVAAAVDVDGDTVSFVPLSAKVSTGHKFDDWVYEKKVVPIALEMAKTLLSGFKFPPLRYSDITLTPPAIVVTSDHIVLLANLSDKQPPPPVLPPDWPNDQCVFRVGPDGVRAATAVVTKTIKGETFHKADSTNIGIGKLYYDVTITADDVRIGDRVSPDRTIDATVSVYGRGSAGIRYILGGSTDGFLKVTLSPDPRLTLRLDLNDDTPHARATAVSDFSVTVSPDGGSVVDKVMAWAADELSGYFKPTVRDALLGFSQDVFTVPSIPVDVDNVHLKAKPHGLKLSVAGDGTVTLRGQLTVG